MKTIIALLTLAAVATTAFAADFTPLFNGKDTDGWKLRRKDGHNSWSVENGVLKNTVNKGEHGTDLVTEKKYWNFTVKYEFQVPDNSNSGFYLRGRHEPAARRGSVRSQLGQGAAESRTQQRSTGSGRQIGRASCRERVWRYV